MFDTRPSYVTEVNNNLWTRYLDVSKEIAWNVVWTDIREDKNIDTIKAMLKHGTFYLEDNDDDSDMYFITWHPRFYADAFAPIEVNIGILFKFTSVGTGIGQTAFNVRNLYNAETDYSIKIYTSDPKFVWDELNEQLGSVLFNAQLIDDDYVDFYNFRQYGESEPTEETKTYMERWGVTYNEDN